MLRKFSRSIVGENESPFENRQLWVWKSVFSSVVDGRPVVQHYGSSLMLFISLQTYPLWVQIGSCGGGKAKELYTVNGRFLPVRRSSSFRYNESDRV